MCTNVHILFSSPTPSDDLAGGSRSSCLTGGGKLLLVLYQPEPKPVICIVPINHILGRLALIPDGAHGTIPYDWHQLQPSPSRPGECAIPAIGRLVGSKLFYSNSWAMIWWSDQLRGQKKT